jgi:hypothetical protein
VVVLPQLATVASLLGGILTLAGLLILGYGAADERPLRQVPAAQALLLVAAVAGVAQTTALQLKVPDAMYAVFAHVIVPGTGLVGGVAVGIAAALLATHRARHSIQTAVFLGLSMIAVCAIVTNSAALIGAHALLSAEPRADVSATLIHLSVLGSGVGQLVIAYGLRRRDDLSFSMPPRR